MPALPVVPNTIKVVTHYSDGLDTSALCRMFLSYSGSAPTAADLNSLATAVRSAWTTNLAPLYSSSGGLGLVVAQDLASNTGAEGTDSTDASGTRAGTQFPRAVAMLFNHTISRRYRGGKPRSYIPLGVSSDIQAGGNWATAFVNSATTAYQAFITALIGQTFGAMSVAAHVNVSYYNGFTVVTNPTTGRARNVPKLRSSPVVDTITNSVANPIPATQRRRNRYT